MKSQFRYKLTKSCTKWLYVSESAQQPLVNWVTALTDLGLATVLVALAVLLLWRLVDLFRRDGRWAKEWAKADQLSAGEEVCR